MAFNAIDTERIIKKVEKMKIRGRSLKVVTGIYNNRVNEVIVRKGVTDRLKIYLGVRQGCSLSSLLFLIFLKDLKGKCKWTSEGRLVIGRSKIFKLKFADDVIVTADIAEGLRGILNDIERYCKKSGLKVNKKNTIVVLLRNGGKKKENGSTKKGNWE